MHPKSPQSLETIEAKVGMSISGRDHYLSQLRHDHLVTGIFTKDGVDNLKLTLRGVEYLEKTRRS
jgi:hypothetical protein